MNQSGNGAPSKPIRLRGHHFICQQVYFGEGRPGTFSESLCQVVALARVTPALIVAGADDLCEFCDCLDPGRICRDPHAGEPKISHLDEVALRLIGAAVGESMTLSAARSRLETDCDAVRQWRDTACSGCQANRLCSRRWDLLLSD